MQCVRKLPEFDEITQNNAITPFKVIQSHRFWYQSKAHIIYDFLLVINADLPPILHRFRDIAVDRSEIATPLVSNSPGGGVPWDDLREIFCGCQVDVNGWPRYLMP